VPEHVNEAVAEIAAAAGVRVLQVKKLLLARYVDFDVFAS